MTEALEAQVKSKVSIKVLLCSSFSVFCPLKLEFRLGNVKGGWPLIFLLLVCVS